jgi:hypothetical protein
MEAAQSHENIGNVLRSRDDLGGALKSYGKARAIWSKKRNEPSPPTPIPM